MLVLELESFINLKIVGRCFSTDVFGASIIRGTMSCSITKLVK
ncbi:hypothetical protein HanHA89_Chr05g0203501 [Helianthus annuus]|nr:hypothetical protein HanHA89_Chr05g0203501 [Helianthus annuus]